MTTQRTPEGSIRLYLELRRHYCRSYYAEGIMRAQRSDKDSLLYWRPLTVRHEAGFFGVPGSWYRVDRPDGLAALDRAKRAPRPWSECE